MNTFEQLNKDCLYCVFDFLTYPELCQLQTVSKSWRQMIKQFEHFKSQQYIKSLPRCEKIEKKIISTLKENDLALFDTNIFKVHEYNLVIDHGYNEAFFGPSQQIFITIHFTYFHQGRFHQIKVYEFFSDDLSAEGEVEKRYVQYKVPGFELSLHVKCERRVFDYEKKSVWDFSKLPILMGFQPGKQFDEMFFVLFSTCTANNEYQMKLQVLNAAEEAIRIDSSFNGNWNNVKNFRQKCEEWLNDWEASLDLSEIEKIKDKITKPVKAIIQSAQRGEILTEDTLYHLVSNLRE